MYLSTIVKELVDHLDNLEIQDLASEFSIKKEDQEEEQCL